MRSPKDFVRELFEKGRTIKHIRAVALGSYWYRKMEEIEHWIDRAENILKKRKQEKTSRSTPISKRLVIKRKTN